MRGGDAYPAVGSLTHRATSLALTRLPASDTGRRIGSIFFNPGGPGGSGVDFLQSAGPFLYSDEVRARFDRGTGLDPGRPDLATGLRRTRDPDPGPHVHRERGPRQGLLRLGDQGGTVPFTYADLVGTTLGAMYSPDAWPDLAAFLQELDTLTSPARAAKALRGLRQHLRLSRVPYEQVLEGFAGGWCLDPVNPDSPSAWARAARRADRRDPYFGRPWNWWGSICASWPGHDRDRHLGPFNRKTANTVLVVGNRNDPATRYQDAVSTSRLLARGRLPTVAGWGHTSLFLSSCADAYVSRYLLTGRVPPALALAQQR